MTRYDQIKELGETFTNLVRRGFIQCSVLSWIEIYEDYLKECETNKKGVAAQYISDKYNCSLATVYNIINYMVKE